MLNIFTKFNGNCQQKFLTVLTYKKVFGTNAATTKWRCSSFLCCSRLVQKVLEKIGFLHILPDFFLSQYQRDWHNRLAHLLKIQQRNSKAFDAFNWPNMSLKYRVWVWTKFPQNFSQFHKRTIRQICIFGRMSSFHQSDLGTKNFAKINALQ